MHTPLFVLLGIVIIAMGIWGLVAGKVVAGSKGLQPNYYYRKDSPFLYYSFIFIYLLIGAFVLYGAL